MEKIMTSREEWTDVEKVEIALGTKTKLELYDDMEVKERQEGNPPLFYKVVFKLRNGLFQHRLVGAVCEAHASLIFEAEEDKEVYDVMLASQEKTDVAERAKTRYEQARRVR